MACKSCQERREWLARYRKETDSSAAKALLALYRKGKESGREQVSDQDASVEGEADSGLGGDSAGPVDPDRDHGSESALPYADRS